MAACAMRRCAFQCPLFEGGGNGHFYLPGFPVQEWFCGVAFPLRNVITYRKGQNISSNLNIYFYSNITSLRNNAQLAVPVYCTLTILLHHPRNQDHFQCSRSNTCGFEPGALRCTSQYSDYRATSRTIQDSAKSRSMKAATIATTKQSIHWVVRVDQ